MGRRRDDEPEWARELGDVRRLEDREKLRLPAPPAATRGAGASDPSAAPVAFEVERIGERVAGRAPGIDRARLRRLAAGRTRVGRTLDLHGLDARSAERALRETLLAARESGERCVLVVHGRGLHSEREAVLKASLVDWLAAPPLGPLVLAFASATPEHGGPGATYVLLRRLR